MIQDDEIEEFNTIFETLHCSLQNKVTSLISNYQVQKVRFSDLYRTYEYNIGKEREGAINESIPVEQEII